MSIEEKPVVKKSYGTPQLNVYGDIRQITETMAMSGSDGGGTSGMTFST